MNRKELSRLRALAGLVYDRERARLQALNAAIAAVAEEVAQVHQARQARAAEVAAALEADFATLADADLRWQDWGDTALRGLQARRARLEIERGERLGATSRAFGRCRAVEALEHRAEDARRIQASRRAEEGG